MRNTDYYCGPGGRPHISKRLQQDRTCVLVGSNLNESDVSPYLGVTAGNGCHCLVSKLSPTHCAGYSSGPPGPRTSRSLAAVRCQAGFISVSGTLYREAGGKKISFSSTNTMLQ